MDPIPVPPPQESKLHFLDYWRIIRIRKTVILAVFLLVVITATVVTFILPPKYKSMARIKIERDQTDIPSLTQQQGSFSPYDPYFMQTEFELMKSEVVLDKVIKNLNLNEEWGKLEGGAPLKKQQTIDKLKRMMDPRQVRNTSLVEIWVTSFNKEEAAKLANEIAEAYQAHRLEERAELTTGGIKSLEERWKEQEASVGKAQSNVDYLRDKLKISDPNSGAEMPGPLLTTESLHRIEGLRIESSAELVKMETLLSKLEELQRTNPAALIQTIPITAPDSYLNSLMEQVTVADQRLVMVQKDYGPENDETKKARESVSDLKQKIKDRVDGIMLGLQAKVASVRESLDQMKKEVDEATKTDISKASESAPYWKAKRELEEQEHFRAILDLKIISEKVDLSLPKTTMVEIVDRAVAPLFASSPNKTLNIALGVIVGLVVGIGLAFFIEYLDTSVKTIDDVERSLQSPVLGVIPQNVGLLVDEGVESPHAEAYRVLRTNLLFSRKDEKLNTVAVVSAGAGEGKSTTVFNLACVFAQGSQRVLIVDSDLRRPTLHRMLRVSNSIGLTNYLLKQNTLEEVIQTTNLPSMDFLASGKLPSSSLGILSSSQMRDLINELKQRYDFVFFDSPPIMGVSDASILASEVDMTLQVIQYRRYPQPMNIRAKQLIEKVGGNLIGIVLNNINMSQDESYYYYSGYYHDYYSRNEDQEKGSGPDEGPGDKTKLDIKPKY
ncbi:Capsular exopolysaccharide family [Verrucomicrobia bacterium]|nr:Capsular exopolysaccharide family [Verrucomicrobiota bacterium]